MRLSVNVVQRCRRDSLLCDSKEALAATSYNWHYVVSTKVCCGLVGCIGTVCPVCACLVLALLGSRTRGGIVWRCRNRCESH